jgi:hypothetical protein
MPTRVDIGKVSSSDPVPSWREDAGDEPAAARPGSATSFTDRPSATTRSAGGTADPLTPAKDATEGAPAFDVWRSRKSVNEPDESAATWRDSSARHGSGTAAPAWPAFEAGDAVADKPASSGSTAEASRTAAEEPASWGGAPWKADKAGVGTRSDGDVAAAGETADDDDAGAAREADAPTGTTGTDSKGVQDDAGAGSAATVRIAPVRSDGDDGEAEPGQGKASSSAKEVTVVPGVPRYHDANCILIRFMPDDDVQRMPVAEAEKAGCTPCSACQSD